MYLVTCLFSFVDLFFLFIYLLVLFLYCFRLEDSPFKESESSEDEKRHPGQYKGKVSSHACMQFIKLIISL